VRQSVHSRQLQKIMFVCHSCRRSFRSVKSLSAHHRHYDGCERAHFQYLLNRSHPISDNAPQGAANPPPPPSRPSTPAPNPPSTGDESTEFPPDDSGSPTPSIAPSPSPNLTALVSQSSQHHSSNLHEPLASQVKLLHILNGINAPHYAFTELWKWAASLTLMPSDTRISLHSAPQKRSIVMRSLSTHYGLDNCAPITKTIVLPSGNIVQLVTHDFKAQLFSLLSDPKLMEEKTFCCARTPMAVLLVLPTCLPSLRTT